DIRTLFSGTGQYVQVGVETAGGQDDVDVFRIGRDDRNEPFGALDACLQKGFIQGGIALQVQVALFIQFLGCLDVLLDDDEGEVIRLELLADQRPDTAKAAYYVMI